MVDQHPQYAAVVTTVFQPVHEVLELEDALHERPKPVPGVHLIGVVDTHRVVRHRLVDQEVVECAFILQIIS